MHKFSALYEFIDRAVKNRNYAPNTAYGLRAALKRFEMQANEEELSSTEKFKSRIDQIYREVVTKNKDFTAESLAVYKSRVIKVLNDFEKYGADPTKMANWTIKAATPRTKRTLRRGSGETSIEMFGQDNVVNAQSIQRIEHPLRPGAKVVIILPDDLTSADIEKVKKLLDLVTTKD